MVNYALNFIRLLLTNEARIVDVKHSAEVAYTAEMQRALKNTVWQSGCSSWYVTGDGWNSTVYPYTQVDFWRRCTFPRWDDWNIEYTSKGIARRRAKRVVRTLALVLAIGGAWRFRQSGLGMVDVKALLRGAVQGSVRNVMEAWGMLRKAVLA
jgi:hypothetical protein